MAKTSLSERLNLNVTGPLCLGSDDPESLTWLIKDGPIVVGWAKVLRLPQHVGMLRELHLSESARNPVIVATRLLFAIFEYARDHALLKLKIHRDCEHDCLRPALSQAGFSHDDPASPGRTLHAYVDLYRNPHHKPHQEPAGHTITDALRVAC